MATNSVAAGTAPPCPDMRQDHASPVHAMQRVGKADVASDKIDVGPLRALKRRRAPALGGVRLAPPRAQGLSQRAADQP
eukprot:9887493-Alexandrium_andersonii.AAC.1